MSNSRNLVDVPWLAARLGDPSLVIVDCRFELMSVHGTGQPGAGRRAYEAAHIPGAVYLDLEQDLSGPKGAHGGRHPLPEWGAFCRTLGAIGVDETVTIVAYDVPRAAVAPRLWWMLRYLGHDPVRVLDGGWPAWLAAGQPVGREIPAPAPRRFAPRPRPGLTADVAEIRRLASAATAVAAAAGAATAAGGGGREAGRPHLVDSRAAERYRGETEPIDPVAGHVPGALNFPWTECLDEHGRLRPRAELAERFAALRDGADVIAYCGSGVTACANLLAMEEAGLTNVRLYPGSWSDWCSYADHPVATAQKEPKR